MSALATAVEAEIVATDQASGGGYRVTVRHQGLLPAPFMAVADSQLSDLVHSQSDILIGRSRYNIAPSLAAEFLASVQQTPESILQCTTVTVQSSREIVCILGRDLDELAKLVQARIPATAEFHHDSRLRQSRDVGRKIGHAAKDLASIRIASFDLQRLEALEQVGESEAFEAVTKSAIIECPELGQLRSKGIPPKVAFATISAYRMLRIRPARHPQLRRTYVERIPRLFERLTKARSIKAFSAVLLRRVEKLGADVVGKRLVAFANRLGIIDHRYGGFYFDIHRLKRNATKDVIVRQLLAVVLEADIELAWGLATNSLAGKSRSNSKAGRPLPRRFPQPLDQLTRSGGPEESFSADQQPDLMQRFGITGIEIGNWVRNEEGRTLQRLIANAFIDLEAIVGQWTTSLCRRGNLAIGIGSRGSGGGCAHYEPGLRVINLTKKYGDGSLAHEFGHYLDHMLAKTAPSTQTRYLSEGVITGKGVRGPIVEAMKVVMTAILASECSEIVAGDPGQTRWFRKAWLQQYGFSPLIPAQQAYDTVADRASKTFRVGRNAGNNSRYLVHSIAKWSDAKVEVQIRYTRESDYFKNAKSLGVYWKRPWELFARAFEAYIEDVLSNRGWINDYLVAGTQRDYSDCRGLPYPVQSERQFISAAIGRLLHAIQIEAPSHFLHSTGSADPLSPP